LAGLQARCAVGHLIQPSIGLEALADLTAVKTGLAAVAARAHIH